MTFYNTDYSGEDRSRMGHDVIRHCAGTGFPVTRPIKIQSCRHQHSIVLRGIVAELEKVVNSPFIRATGVATGWG